MEWQLSTDSLQSNAGSIYLKKCLEKDKLWTGPVCCGFAQEPVLEPTDVLISNVDHDAPVSSKRFFGKIAKLPNQMQSTCHGSEA